MSNKNKHGAEELHGIPALFTISLFFQANKIPNFVRGR